MPTLKPCFGQRALFSLFTITCHISFVYVSVSVPVCTSHANFCLSNEMSYVTKKYSKLVKTYVGKYKVNLCNNQRKNIISNLTKNSRSNAMILSLLLVRLLITFIFLVMDAKFPIKERYICFGSGKRSVQHLVQNLLVIKK